jgi:hypothetical protein
MPPHKKDKKNGRNDQYEPAGELHVKRALSEHAQQVGRQRLVPHRQHGRREYLVL